MTEQIPSQALAESLSALMDNQASELELMRLLKALDSDPELKATWSRYQLASASLRSDLPGVAPASFAARISVALESEETYSVQSHDLPVQESTKITSWWQQLGRVAVAASVAGILVVGVQQYQGDSLPGTPMTAESTLAPTKDFNPADLPSGINAPALSARTVAVQSGYESRPQETRRLMYVPRQEEAPIYNEDISTYVNQLIEEHSGNAALNSGQGILPYTRVILIDEE